MGRFGCSRAAVGLAGALLGVLPAPAITGDLASEPYASIELGGFSSEQELAEFLRTAPVVKIEEIGQGITRPKRVTLSDQRGRCRAIFKTVDITSTEIQYTNRFEELFRDSYAHEVAAYRVDRLLGMGLVPVTVLREIDGVAGSLQYWVEDAIQAQDALDKDLPLGDEQLLLERVMLMYVLDAVIYNVDRNLTNVLVRPDRDDFFLIDHSRAFRTNHRLPSQKEERAIPVPARVARSLRALDRETLLPELGELLSKDQIHGIEKRCPLLVQELEGRGLLPPPD